MSLWVLAFMSLYIFIYVDILVYLPVNLCEDFGLRK